MKSIFTYVWGSLAVLWALLFLLGGAKDQHLLILGLLNLLLFKAHIDHE